MDGIGIAVGPADPFPLDREKWEKVHDVGLDWGSTLVPVRMIVELPFWLMIPDSQFSISHLETTVTASTRGDYFEVMHGPSYCDSHVNFLQMGADNDLRSEEFEKARSEAECPVFRSLKTVVIFQPDALQDALHAYAAEFTDRGAVRRYNLSLRYFEALARGHLPFLNKLITSYRSTSFDPFAFEVSEWDVPIWWIEHNHKWVRIGVMPYVDMDQFPQLTNPSTREKTPAFTTSVEDVQTQLQQPISAGKGELLDALSLFYRGRFGDAIRSAVTAIEVAVEAQLRKLLKSKGYTDDAVVNRLAESRKSFNDRIAEYEKMSKKRLPGPVLSWVPYINGIRLKSELESVRSLRHQIVHEGIRLDPGSRGLTLRAIETMTWLFQWLHVDEKFIDEQEKNYNYYSAMRGNLFHGIEYTDAGVKVLPLDDLSTDSDRPITTSDQVLDQQFVAALSPEVNDLELFVAMSLEYLNIPSADAPPPLPEDPVLRERFHLNHQDGKLLVFCIGFDGLMDDATMGQIALRSLIELREWQNGFLRFVCIVHHQRHMPTELREVATAFSEEIHRMAEKCGVALFTAPDLLLLVRGMNQHGWERREIVELFFRVGRQGMYPPCYRKIGTYQHYYGRHSAMRVELTEGQAINLGDLLGIRLRDRYHEETVKSLQVNGEPVETAAGPCAAGIQTTLRRSELQVGQPVFVRKPAETPKKATKKGKSVKTRSKASKKKAGKRTQVKSPSKAAKKKSAGSTRKAAKTKAAKKKQTAKAKKKRTPAKHRKPR